VKLACYLLYSSVLPQAALCWSLYSLALEPRLDPLATFSLSLPAGWGEPLGWALTFLPLSPILIAAIIHLTCGARGVPKIMVRKSFLVILKYLALISGILNILCLVRQWETAHTKA
jgi:hypothetical protein